MGAVAEADVDRELVKAVAAGSADALAQLYDRHAATVYGLARRIVTRLEDAEEVVQDVFAQIWRKAHEYREDRAAVAGWIVMLARTRAIDRLRAIRARPDDLRRVPVGDQFVVPSAERSPEQAALSGETARRIGRALESLPESQRSSILLAYFEGLSHSEIAARTATPLGTVKTRIRSAMESLREALR